MSEVRITGLAELGQALQRFGEVIETKYLRRAVFAAAQIIEEDAITRAPVRTGALRDAIAIFRRKSPPGTAHYAIGVRKIKFNRKEKRVLRIIRRAGMSVNIAGDIFYWRYLEFGTSKMAARPFLRPAFESRKSSALDTFVESLADGVKRATYEAKG